MKTTIASILLLSVAVTAQESAFASTSSTRPSSYPSIAPSPDSDNPLPPDKQPRSDFRCGISEVDARSNCNNECASNLDCAEGEFCWSTFSNYCHLMPDDGHPTCDPKLAEETIRRCGFDEQSARSYCGLECETEVECPEGEVCFRVQRNLCECFEDQDEATPVDVVGTAKTNREYFDDAKLVIAEFFLAPPEVFCFSGSGLVQVQETKASLDVPAIVLRQKPLRDMRLGDVVQVDSDTFEPVYSFGHYAPDAVGTFVQLRTDQGKSLQISEDHMLYVRHQEEPIPAKLLQIGHQVLVVDGEPQVIQSLQTNQRSRGVFAPFTPSGKIVVNGIQASTFVALTHDSHLEMFGMRISHQWIAHSFEAPHRWYCQYCQHESSSCTTKEYYTKKGISTWVATPHRLAQWMLTQHAVIQTVLGGLFLAVLVLFNVMEWCLEHSSTAAAIVLGLSSAVLMVLQRQRIHSKQQL